MPTPDPPDAPDAPDKDTTPNDDKGNAGTKAGGSTGGSTGTGQGGAPDNGVPSPMDPGGRFLWFTCIIGDFILPPHPSYGAITVEAESGAKKDKKKGAGKSKSKTTKQGKSDVKIKLHLEIDARAWGDGPWGKGWESALTELDPNGPNSGGPYPFSHPDSNRRGVKSVMVDKIGKLVWKGFTAAVEIDLSEWTEPNKAAGAGSTTPDHDGKNWTCKGGQKDPGKRDPLDEVNNSKAPSAAPTPANN